MRSRVDFIVERAKGNLAESGTQVTLCWNVWPSGAVRDPVTNAFPGTATPQRLIVPAFLYFVSASASVRQFGEVQTGDCIADFSPEVTLKGLDGLFFLLPTGPGCELEQWTNKPLSQDLAAYWDVMQSGRKILQTVLLRKGT